MKRFLLPIAVLSAFFFASCGGDGGEGNEPELTEEQKAYLAKVESVEQNTKAIFMKSSGTLCPPCGGWGWEVNSQVTESARDFAGTFTVHSANFVSKDFINQEGNEIDAQFGVSGWPTFLANNGIGGRMGKTGGGSTVTDYVNTILGDIDAISGQAAIANAAVNYTIANNTITVNSRTRFFEEAAEGEYYIAIWIDEDGPTAPQAGYANGIPEHHHVLRTSTDNHATFGVPLNTAGEVLPKDTLIERTHTAEFPEGLWNKDRTTVTAIIWSVSGNLTKSYGVVNVSRDMFTEE